MSYLSCLVNAWRRITGDAFIASVGSGTRTGPVGKTATKHFRMLIRLILLWPHKLPQTCSSLTPCLIYSLYPGSLPCHSTIWHCLPCISLGWFSSFNQVVSLLQVGTRLVSWVSSNTYLTRISWSERGNGNGEMNVAHFASEEDDFFVCGIYIISISWTYLSVGYNC